MYCPGYFMGRGDALCHFSPGIFQKRAHTRCRCAPPEFPRRHGSYDFVSQIVVHHKQLENSSSPSIPTPAARAASMRSLACCAASSHQALGNDSSQATGHEEGWDTHVEKAEDCPRRVGGVNGR